MPRQDLIQMRRDTAANWTSVDPVLAAGEFGFESDTNKLKCGNGSTAWSSLTYISGSIPTTSISGGDFTGELSLTDNIVGTEYNSYDISTEGAITFSLSGNEVDMGIDMLEFVSDGTTAIASQANLDAIFYEQYGIPADRILPSGTHTLYFQNTPYGVVISSPNTINVSSTTEVLGLAFGDETSDIETGTAKLTFQMPNFATNLVGVAVNLKTAPTGSVATFDLNENGVSVLSTKITIDAGETTSETAATPPVISDSSIAANAIMTVDIDGVGSSTAGVAPKLWIYYTRA